MTTLEAIVAGEVFNLSDRVRRWHLGNEGFGLPPVTRFEERGPYQHGVTDTGFRLDPRLIRLDLLVAGGDADDYWTTREELVYIFAPRDQPLSLRWTFGDEASPRVRQIDCYLAAPVPFPSSERYGGDTQRVIVNLRAPDPTWYDPEVVTVNFGISGGGGAMEVPLAIPWNVGTSVLNQATAIAYQGTWDAFPVITIRGPITNPVITNEATGDVLDFTGVALSGSDVYTIDTRYGYKEVYAGGNPEDNRIHELTQDSDLSTFRLARRPDAPGGVNTIRVTGTNVNTTTQVYLAYNTRYLGL